MMADRPHAFPEDVAAAHVSGLVQSLEANNVKAIGLNTCRVSVYGDGYAPSWLDDDWMEREKRIRYTLDCLRLAAALGVPHISIEGASPVPAIMHIYEAWRLFLANMHRVVPLARRLGVKILLQPEPGVRIRTSSEVLAFIEEMGSPEHLRVDFDAAHFFHIGEDPCEAWEKLKSLSSHVHLADIRKDQKFRCRQLGEGEMDIPAFLQCVRDSGYEGFVTVKVDAYEQMADEVVNASAHYLREKGFMPSGGMKAREP